MINAATPAFSFIFPSCRVPSENVTIPVGTPALDPTFAVKVTFCPYKEGLRLALKLTVEGAVVIPSTTGAEVTPAWAKSPL